MYALLNALKFREKYNDFLKLDFPHIPFAADIKAVEKLSQLGWGLLRVHLQEQLPPNISSIQLKQHDKALVSKISYSPQKERLHLNNTVFF